MIQFRCNFSYHSAILPIALLAGVLASGLALGQVPGSSGEAPVVATKEYIFQQQADVDLVIRVTAREAAYESFVSSEEDGVFSESALPNARMLPVFHFVASVDRPRQIDIDINATQVTNRTDFDLQLTRLNVRDDRTADIVNGYRLLGSGLQAMRGGNTAQWSVRIQTLFRAANQFEEIGMQEMRLWSRALGAHLILAQLNDHQTALDWADDLLNEPRISRYPDIEFAAIKLRSSAMAEGRVGTGGEDPTNSPYQLALARTVEAARALDYKFEEALAMMEIGVDLIDNGLHRQAQEPLASALAIAEEIEAADLAAAIREQMVETHSQTGNLDATGEILQDIETHLVQEGEQQELAHNLVQQGRVFRTGFRYTQAIDVLSRALTLEQTGLSRLEAELELGLALAASGRNEGALVHLYRAAVNPQNGEFRRPGNVLNVSAALYEIAAIHRHQQEWGQLQEIRTAQRAFLNTPSAQALFEYQLGVDALRRHGPAASATADRFGSALRMAQSAGQADLENLARLGLCSLNPISVDTDSRCPSDELRAGFAALQTSSTPVQEAESVLFFARILDQSGQARQAFRVSEELIQTLIVSGHAPLGSWYWQWRDLVASDYLGMAMKTESNPGLDATASLLALIKIRTLERGAGTSDGPVDSDSLQNVLRSLPADAVVLSYFLTDSTALAWVGERNRTRRFSLNGSDRVKDLSHDFRQAVKSGSSNDFDRITRELGSILVEPIADYLGETVFLVNQAPLLGIPLDILQVDGTAVAVRHSVSHLELVSTAPIAVERLRVSPPSTVFLAGDPQDWSGEFASRLEASEELQAVSDLFVGPGLHAVQGVSLQRDEFQDGRYQQAELVHLAVPGNVELAPGYASGLFLSESTRGDGREILDADTLAAIPITARLAFLSRTEFGGTGAAQESRKGVVNSLLDAGANAVIASLWSVDPAFRKQFVEDFYTRLLDEQNIVTALATTKRESIQNGEPHHWASFQLFLN